MYGRQLWDSCWCWQRYFGGRYGRRSPRNFSNHIPLGARQSKTRAELWVGLKALRLKQPAELLSVVMDAEVVYKGVTEWMYKWRRHGWVEASGPVGSSDPCQRIHALVILHGDTLSCLWLTRLTVQATNRQTPLRNREGSRTRTVSYTTQKPPAAYKKETYGYV